MTRRQQLTRTPNIRHKQTGGWVVLAYGLGDTVQHGKGCSCGKMRQPGTLSAVRKERVIMNIHSLLTFNIVHTSVVAWRCPHLDALTIVHFPKRCSEKLESLVILDPPKLKINNYHPPTVICH